VTRVANRPVFPGTSRFSGPVSRVPAWVFPGRKMSRIFVKPSVRYAEFKPRPVNQAGAQDEEAVREIANGGARQRRRRGKMHKRRAYRVAGSL